MQTNSTNKLIDLRNLKEFTLEKEIWTMTTSHESILRKFINGKNFNKISIEKIDDTHFSFKSPEILNAKKGVNSFGATTVQQFIRILIFYNVIPFDVISKIHFKNWNELID